jgi:hypothetical protein
LHDSTNYDAVKNWTFSRPINAAVWLLRKIFWI